MSAMALAVLAMAVNCGTPTPEIIRVVQIEPGPIPTLIASAPAISRSRVPSVVATLPAITSISCRRLISLTVSTTFFECPWALSTTSTSTPFSNRAATRSKSFTPTAAPTRNRPLVSFEASGNRRFLSMSLIVINPFNR